MSKRVFTFNSCSQPSYHLVNDVPLLIYAISSSNQAEIYFVFVDVKVVHELPTLFNGMQPDFMLVPITYEDPKSAVIHGFFSLNQFADSSSFPSPLNSSSFACSHE